MTENTVAHTFHAQEDYQKEILHPADMSFFCVCDVTFQSDTTQQHAVKTFRSRGQRNSRRLYHN